MSIDTSVGRVEGVRVSIDTSVQVSGQGSVLRTVKSIQRGDFPTRRAAAARAAPSTPRLVSAARVGPVVYGLLLAFRGDGYG